MASPNQLVAIPGSELPPQYAEAIGPASENETITVTVKVRARDEKAAASSLEELAAREVVGRPVVGQAAFAASHGADPADLKKVEDYARGKGLSVVESSS